jgi:hypothetical protein
MECKHALPPWFCPSCEDGRPTWVFRTVGGSSYHARKDCELRAEGNRQAHHQGLVDHPVERITRAEAEAYLYQPCPACIQPNRDGLIDSPAEGLPGERVWAGSA